jgi:hypothetical protein
MNLFEITMSQAHHSMATAHHPKGVSPDIFTDGIFPPLIHVFGKSSIAN